jgi:cyclopropane-fatty-acyl-phospholipid synthase
MSRGRLVVQLPEGGVRQFGSGDDGPSAVIHIRSERFFRRCLFGGDIGFGEAYQAEEWDSPDLAAVIGWFCANASEAPTMSGSARRSVGRGLLRWANRLRHFARRNTVRGSRANIEAHYDLGNDFYQLWLDPTMTYSSALFESPDQELSAAQSAKYERLCRILHLRPTDRVLEVGCGWGGFASHAARHHGCRVTAITISPAQKAYAEDRMIRERVGDRVDVRLLDYRRLPGSGIAADKIASIEMLEAVGDENLESCFSSLNAVLSPRGLLAAQFIVCPDARGAELRRDVDWVQKHVFPGSLLLSMPRLLSAAARTGDFWLHDLKDMGPDYAATLRRWRGRFNAQLDAVRSLGFDDRFVRTWNYYLAYCEAAFAWRNISVVQALWTRSNNPALSA